MPSKKSGAAVGDVGVIKFLFFDYQEVERTRGFTRRLHQPVKHEGNPLLLPASADAPWESGNMQLYGSVVRRPDGLFQLWYQTQQAKAGLMMGYAESDDSRSWPTPAPAMPGTARRRDTPFSPTAPPQRGTRATCSAPRCRST